MHVISLRPLEQMVWIRARPDITPMTNKHAITGLRHEYFVASLMHVIVFILESELTVSSRHTRVSPDPAAGFRNANRPLQNYGTYRLSIGWLDSHHVLVPR